MKPIYATAFLFLFNNEVVSMLAACVLLWYVVVKVCKEVPHD